MRLLPWILVVTACPGGTNPTDTDPDTGTNPVDRGVTVRVVTWNVKGMGTASSAEGQAERAILARLDADVIGLNEVDDDELVGIVTSTDLLRYLQEQF